MFKRLLLKLAAWMIRRTYVGKKALRVVPSGGVTIVAGEGLIIGSGFDWEKGTFVLKFLENGHSFKHARNVDYRDLRYEKNMGLVFND
jgi:hypothetical protein